MTPDDYAEMAARALSQGRRLEGVGFHGSAHRLYESAVMLLSASNEHSDSGRLHACERVEEQARVGRWFALTQDADGNIYIDGERRDG